MDKLFKEYLLVHAVAVTGHRSARTPFREASFFLYAGFVNGGGSEIRTHEELAPLPLFESGGFNQLSHPS